MIRFDTRGARELAASLPKLGVASVGAVYAAMGESAMDLRNTWRRNARETSGTHGRLYPNSIVVHPRLSTGVVFDIGPDPRLPQGGMSFEFGSSKQPPHLDGQRAMDEVQPRLEKRVSDAVNGIFEQAATVTGSEKFQYTTRSGKTIMATQAQINNWTRGSR